MAVTVVGRRLTDRHKQAQQKLAVQTVADLRRVWRMLSRAQLDETQGLWLAAALPILRDANLESQVIAAQYLDGFRAEEAPDAPARQFADPDPDPAASGRRRSRVSVRIRDAVDFDERSAAAALFTTGPARVRVALPAPEQRVMDEAFVSSSGAGVRIALDGGRDYVRNAVDLDNAALGYARVTKAKPCWFCAMLASLGAVYKHEKSFATSDARFEGEGLAKVHNGCQCVLEPIYSKESDLPGRAAEFRELWRTVTKGKSGKEATSAFRRAYEQQQRDDAAAEAESGVDGPPPPADPPNAPASGDPEEPRGSVDRTQVKHVHQHELDTADRLATIGFDVVLRTPAGEETNDSLLNGVRAEFKSPTSGSRNTVMSAISRKRQSQGPQFVLDVSRSSMTFEQATAVAENLVDRYRNDGISSILVINQDLPDGPVDHTLIGEEVPQWPK